MDEQKAAQLDCWCIIELFGHSRIAGKARAENFGAACMVRVDVPAVVKHKQRYDYDKHVYIPDGQLEIAPFTKYLGMGSIYALTPVTEDLAKAAATEISAEPVSVFGLDSVKRIAKELPGEPESQGDDNAEMLA